MSSNDRKTKISPNASVRAMRKICKLYKSSAETASPCNSRRKCFDFASACWLQFTNLLSLGQIEWRHSLGNAHITFAEAIRVAHNAADCWKIQSENLADDNENIKPFTTQGFLWTEVPNSPDAIPFRFGTAALLSFLCDSAMPLKILSQIPKRDNWELLCHHFFPNYPDGLLASTLIGACALEEFLDFLQNEALQAYPKMLVQSYILYHNLIKSIKSSHTDSMQYHIEQIKQSFLERAKFDDFPPWDGAKESNHLSVDFRLVSILYYSIVNKTMSLSQVTAEMLVEQHVLPPPQIGNWNILVDKK